MKLKASAESVLHGALRRLETPGAWKAGALARGKDGMRLPANDKGAVFFSLLGALRAARCELEAQGYDAVVAERDAIEIIQHYGGRTFPISELDRKAKMTQETVIALLGKALSFTQHAEVANG